eukprot:s619_g22.t1
MEPNYHQLPMPTASEEVQSSLRSLHLKHQWVTHDEVVTEDLQEPDKTPWPALSPFDIIQLLLGFTTAAPDGTEVRAEGLSPSAIPFNLTGDIFAGFFVSAVLTPGFVGSPAAGLWNLSAFMESGSAVIDDANLAPQLLLRVEPC